MIRRSSRILLEVLVGLLSVLALLGAGAAWRLSQGPVSLAFAVPYVDEQLAQTGSPLAIGLDDIILTWGGWDRTLDIRVLGVVARNSGGTVIAAMPEVSVRLAIVPLAYGEIRPTRLELIKPLMLVHRMESGAFEIAVGEDIGPTGDTLPLLIHALLDPSGRDSPLGSLDRISVVGGDLTVDDRKLRTIWKAPRVDIVLARHKDGLSAQFDLEAEIEGQRPSLSGTAHYDVGDGKIIVDAAVKGVRPDRLAKKFAVLAPLGGVVLPVEANFNITMTADGSLLGGDYRLSAGAGALKFPKLVPRTVPIRSAIAHGSFDVVKSRIVLDEAKLDLGGPSIELSANFTRKNDTDSIDAKTVVRKLPLADLKSYWPDKGNQSIRAWIAVNMEGGELSQARASIGIRSTRSGVWSLDLSDARMRIEGVTVHYFKPLTPVRKVGATITVGSGRVDIAVDSGDLNGLDVDPVTIGITDDGADNWNLSLVAELRGAVRNALEILDHPRLEYASGLGLDVARTTGESAIRMQVELPLLADLRMDQVDIRAAAKLVNVDMPGAVFGHDASDGALTLRLDRTGMTVSGTAALAQVPATIEWYENFVDDAPIVRRYNVKATLDAAARKRLGLDTAPYLTGPVVADIQLIKRSDASSELVGRFALDRATLSLEPFGWSKQSAVPGEGRFEIDLAGERITAVRHFDINAAGLVARGSIAFDGDGKTVRRADVQRFSVGERTEVSGVVARRRDGGFDISISGSALDGESLVNFITKAGKGAATLSPMRLGARFDRLWVAKEAKVDNAAIDAEYDGATWRLVTASGQLSGNSVIEAIYRDNQDNASLTVNSNDTGTLLRTFGVANPIVGGRLALEASTAGRGDSVPWRGQLAVTDFRVIKAPVLARLLSLASLTGISSLVTSKGIHFSRLDIPFAMQSKRLTISNARAIGSQIGIGATGAIDLQGDNLQLEGIVVPAYTLNRLIGYIPLIGKILTGGDGGGVFAVDYSLSGPLDKPEINVNPIASLAPGILRNLLRGLAKSGSDPDLPPEPESNE